MKASWGDHTATIASRRDLDAVIDDVRRSGRPTMAVPERDALAAAEQFLASRDRPTAVPWESD